MESRTKAIIWGGILGTIMFGPVVGTLVGAKVAADMHDGRFGDPAEDATGHSNRDVP